MVSHFVIDVGFIELGALVARGGGDEFVVVVRGITDARGAGGHGTQDQSAALSAVPHNRTQDRPWLEDVATEINTFLP